ncbi:putative leucine-rich repeat domain superfamily, F-box-like domain superfamily [Helianthus annuus]|nr:putative leucine-rich repeat domain superfamily, F-box-like domain superfamily [Helianthus annuus]
MKAKRLSKAQRLSKAKRLDRITTLPQTIIETIISLLPFEEAARTSILSKEWRYKWTTIPKVEFEDLYHPTVKLPGEEIDQNRHSRIEIARRNMAMPFKLFYAIQQVLLLRQGPILEFTLSIYAHRSCFEIDQIILHLSRNHTVKKLKFHFKDFNSCMYCLPVSFFSLHHLTDLDLEFCGIYHKPIFNGFSSLTSLSLRRIGISQKSLLHLLSKCPSLKSFSLSFVVDHSVPQALPTLLIHLKYFYFRETGFVDYDGLTFIAILLKCSPNLEKMELEVDTDEDSDKETLKLEEYSIIFENYSDVWLEHLNELKIQHFRNFNPELELVKFILARSPNLKKVILITWINNKNEELELLNVLSHAARASQVEIVVENLWTESDSDDYEDV